MLLLDFVQWDRYSGNSEKFVVFGWIARPDGRSDFVLLRVDSQWIGFTTSSAEYSEEISRRLNDGVPTGTHTRCHRVEFNFSAQQVPNVIRTP